MSTERRGQVDKRQGLSSTGSVSTEQVPVSGRRRSLLALAGAAALWLTACDGGGTGSPTKPSGPGAAGANAEQGVSQLMSLVLPTLDGGEQALAQWQGRPLLINFWATWCAPCVHEMPDLEALQNEFSQVQFVGLGVDTLENMQQFRERVKVSYPLLGARAVGLDLMRQLGNVTGGLPYTLLIDANGRVRRQVAGQIDPAALRQDLQQLV